MSEYCLPNIIDGIRNRDRDVFSWLFDRYSHTMYLIALDILNDHELARDTVQEAFLKLWEKSATIDIQSSIKSYLFRTAANIAINRYRKESRIVRPDHLPEIQDTNTRLENKAEEKELEQYIHHAIDSLPPQCRKVFTLSRFSDMSAPDIAQHLNISINTVYTHLTMAIRIIKERLKKEKLFFNNH
ncbi:RNA polymerase sigma-70 factor [Paraflavitalea sp. CAU 1676]|uniref:RNA polymerase sigma factor n=1 Tax=Paraflavitalea sp. CAU 1676 TaxID=3032598 RepID=UPI0023DAE0AB|nr:RNA polymerase sigma-70 factor [Paraflavitalea sp. CAU 1676]MDF2190723.1 RNA polymerase sigma-70 factor [Paraflavitalea sp. CAU 1676]